MPRVTPVASKADVAAEHQAVVDDVLGVFGAVRGPFSIMLHSPEMTKRLLPLVPFFRDERVVDGKLRSVSILAAVREREAAYVWAAQVAAARRNGLRGEAIDLLRAKADPSKFPAEEAAIVTYPSAHAHKSRGTGRVRCPPQKTRYEVARRADRWRALLRNAVRRRERVRGGSAAGRRQAAGVAPHSFGYGGFWRAVARHDGRIVNTWGDAVIAEFASVVEAVQCAVEIQQEITTSSSSCRR
jgi:hypothetical protein